MMQRGENLAILLHRRHKDGSVRLNYMQSFGFHSPTMGEREDLEFVDPDEAADYLIELAEKLRSRRARRKTG